MGHYRWVELKLFETLGRWVATVPEPDVKRGLAVHGQHHAGHAEHLRAVLPELGHPRPLDAELLTCPANPAVEELMVAVAQPQAPDLTIEKLVGAYRVVIPHLIATYSYHLSCIDEIADGPVIREIGFIQRDLVDDAARGERLLEALVATPRDIERATHHQNRLQELLLASGGVAGPGTLGSSTAREK